MIRNPDKTRLRILNKSGVLFNTQGYKATSISDITTATGFTKGAIYRHFKNKEELERETLAHLSNFMFERIRERIKQEKTSVQKLKAIFQFFDSYVTKPELKGGCPLLNAAIESDDANPILRKQAVKVLNILHDSIIGILANGVKHKQLKKDIDMDAFATMVISCLEGAIMMSKLRGNNDDIRKMIVFLERQVENIRI